MKLNIQQFGGRGASSSFKGGTINPNTGTTYPNVNMTQSQFIKSVIAEENELTRGDVQGLVEAYANENQLTPITQEKILRKIDSGIDEARASKEKYSVEYHKARGTEIRNSVPKGYIKLEGATTAPRGYEWYFNGKSRFGGEYKAILVKKKK